MLSRHFCAASSLASEPAEPVVTPLPYWGTTEQDSTKTQVVLIIGSLIGKVPHSPPVSRLKNGQKGHGK